MEIIGNPWDSSDSSSRKSWPLDFNPLCCIAFFLCLGPKQRHADILNPSLQDLHQLKLSKFWVNLVTSDPWLSRISFSGMQGVAQAVADPNRTWNVSFLWSSVASLSCGTVPRIDEIIVDKWQVINRSQQGPFFLSVLVHPWFEACRVMSLALLIQNFAMTSDKIVLCVAFQSSGAIWRILESQGDSIRQELDMQKMEISSASADLSRPDLCLRRCLRRCMIWHSLTFLCSYLQVSWRLTWVRVFVTDVWFGHFSHSISVATVYILRPGWWTSCGCKPGATRWRLDWNDGGDQIIAFIDDHRCPPYRRQHQGTTHRNAA